MFHARRLAGSSRSRCAVFFPCFLLFRFPFSDFAHALRLVLHFSVFSYSAWYPCMYALPAGVFAHFLLLSLFASETPRLRQNALPFADLFHFVWYDVHVLHLRRSLDGSFLWQSKSCTVFSFLHAPHRRNISPRTLYSLLSPATNCVSACRDFAGPRGCAVRGHASDGAGRLGAADSHERRALRSRLRRPKRFTLLRALRVKIHGAVSAGASNADAARPALTRLARPAGCRCSTLRSAPSPSPSTRF